METIYNVYCDESCHLENDPATSMVLGCVWCPADQSRALSERIRGVKAFHGLVQQSEYGPGGSPFETKWTKISPAKADFYCDLVDAFFEEPKLAFRGILIPDKRRLEHDLFNQTHDDWYYKMMFLLLDRIINPRDCYRIYLDIKDTRSESKRSRLEKFLRTSARDTDGQVIERVQQIRSHESELMQLADLMIGAIAYHNRLRTGDLQGRAPSQGKLEVIRRIQRRSGKSLQDTTWQGERKLNLLRWEPGGGGLIPC